MVHGFTHHTYYSILDVIYKNYLPLNIATVPHHQSFWLLLSHRQTHTERALSIISLSNSCDGSSGGGGGDNEYDDGDISTVLTSIALFRSLSLPRTHSRKLIKANEASKAMCKDETKSENM